MALEWYARCGEHLGQSFEQEIERTIQFVAASPERWAKYGSYHRRILVRRFPYILVYLLRRTRIGFFVRLTRARIAKHLTLN